MAYTNVAAIGLATTTSSVSSLAMSPTSNIVVDKVVFFCAATYNDATAIVSGPTSRHTSVADNTATPNTWNKLGEWTQTAGSSNDGTTLSFWWTKVRTQINTTDTITLTIGTAVGRLVISAVVADIGAGSIPVIQQVDYKPNVISATVSNLPSQEYLLIGFGATKRADSSKTPDADYLELFDLSVGTTTVAISTHVVYRIATLTTDICTSSSWTTINPLFTLWAITETYASVSASVSPSLAPSSVLLGSVTDRKDFVLDLDTLYLVRFAAINSGTMNYVKIGIVLGGHVKIALYTDNAGSPDVLINSIGATACSFGINTLAFPATTITASTYYWFAIVTNTSDNLFNDDFGTYYYGAFPFANSFPDPISGYTLNGTIGFYIQGISLDAGSASISPSASVSPTASPSVSPTASPSLSPSSSVSPSVSKSKSKSSSVSPSISRSASVSPSISSSGSISPSLSPSFSVSPSVSPSVSRSVSPSVSVSVSPSISPSLSASQSISPSTSTSPSLGESPSVSPSISPSISKSVSASLSKSHSVSPSVSSSISPSRSMSPSSSPSAGIYGGILKRWNGVNWVKEPLQVYLGGSWQTKLLKVYLAGNWETVDISGI